MSVTHPVFLLLLPILVAFSVVARRRRRVPRGPWPLILWLRLPVALLIVLALAGLRLPAPARSVATVFVVDLSSSVPADIREGAKNWVRQSMAKRGPDDLSAIVTFARESRVELPLGKELDHPTWGEPPAGSATNIAMALELAADLLPAPRSGAVRRIVLLSDGNETAGDAQHALLRPQLRDVEVAVVSLPQRLQDTAITGLAVPPALREGEGAELRVAILSPVSQEGTLRVWAIAGPIQQLLYEQPVQLENGPKEVVVPGGELPKGAWAFHASLSVSGDSLPENNESWAFTIVGEAARVLLVEGTAGEASAFSAALADAKIQVDTLRPQQLPTTQLDPLLAYESVVLANVHGSDLRRDQMAVLQRYVAERGRGLVVLGGDRTFGLGDYAGTPLEETLPVAVQPPDREQAASLALLLVVDRSGSMLTADTVDRRTTRMELAKEGAIQAVEALQVGDQVGVIGFDYMPRWIASMRPIRDPQDARAVNERIATIQPDGGTDIYAALDAAYKGLQQVSARVKHVILLTDGEGQAAAFPQLMAAMQRAGITVSTVGVSSESGTALLQDLARRGKGRYYFAGSARDVPRIMTQETRLAGRSYRQDRDFKPRLVTAAPAVRGLVPSEFPPLHGYVRVSPKPGSETVLASDQEEAVLSQWQYGLGRTLAWMADAQGEWSRDWASSVQFTRLWPQAVRWTMPTPLDPGLQITIRGDGEQAMIRVESFEATGEFRNLLRTQADIWQPDGSGKQVPLQQVAPGRYEARFSLTGPGAYFIQVTQAERSGQVVARQTMGYALPHLPEHELTAANRVLMERLAAETGGPRVTQVQDVWRRDTRQALQPQEVWSYLLPAALILFVADVAVRRLRPTLRDFGRVRTVAGLGRLGGTSGSNGTGSRWLRPRVPRLRLSPLFAGRRR